jgi:membrane-associated phospholipid phosphatase
MATILSRCYSDCMQQPNKFTGTLFIRLSILMVAFLLLLVIFFSKAVSFLWFNMYHNSWLDSFFTYFTNLGDGIVAGLIIVLLLLLGNRMLAGKLLVAFIVSGLVAQVLKNLFHAPRPQSYFLNNTYHHFIAGITHCGFASFPSGHTTTAFAVATLLTCHARCNKTCLLFFVLACGVGYSRVYLGQHFVPDVLAGMVIGITTAMIVENLTLFIKIPKLKRYAAPQHEQPALEL